MTFARLCGQVGPPDLRCLEVLSNGDVKLSWLPPEGSTAGFSHYEIFSSISPAGPFALVPASITPVGTNTYVVAAANATAQSKYFFMRSRFNSGADSSVSSDTLGTIFLNIYSVAPALQLKYNPIHLPPLPSTSANFTITREYPLGTVNNFAVLSASSYADTLDICHAFINYRVGISDQSGCISASNLIMGEYYDMKDPDTTRVDSISVMENGTTVLAWQIPRDKDIVKYKIIENTGGPNNYIDSVNGRQTTSYTYSSTLANSRIVKLFVNAQDSCRLIGNFDETPETMYLIPVYDRCGYRTMLNWNAYKGLRGGILEYRIYYSVNGSAYKRVGSTTATSFVHQDVDPGQNICYFIRVVNNDQTITASSNRACFFSEQVQMPAFLYIRSADVLTDNSVQLRVYVDDSMPITGIEIMRSSDSTSFEPAGFIPYDGTKYYVFTDTDVQTSSTSYYYSLRFRDSCGNPRASSNTARTMLLRVDPDEGNIFVKHLSWNRYQGFSGEVSGYNIYRMVNEQAAGAPVASTGPEVLSYTDNMEDAATMGARVEYLVEAVEGLANIYGIQELSHSNRVPVYMEGQIFVPNAFAPSGVNKTWRPVTHFIDKNEYRVRVFNRWGEKVFETTDDSQAWDGANCLQGVYVYLISHRNARGEYMERKGTVTLLR